MTYTLSDGQYEDLRGYFELALTAISDEEDIDLLSREKPLREMLRALTPDQPETH